MATRISEGEKRLAKGGKLQREEEGTQSGKVWSVRHYFEVKGSSLGAARKEASGGGPAKDPSLKEKNQKSRTQCEELTGSKE